jgi:hypothetical protein
VKRLSLIPLPNITVVLADVAASAGRDKVRGDRHATFDLGDDVIKRDLLGLAAAVGAASLPAVDDLPPETVFGNTFGNKL